MPQPSSRTLRFLRLGALMLLVLSILARPMMEQRAGIHGVEHAVLAAADANHGHGHDHANHDHDSTKDPEHTKGLHGLMHQAECGAAVAPCPAWSLALALRPADAPPLPETTAPRLGVPATPFRPPIA